MANSSLVAGLDEVGMGCLAGPLVVVVAAFPEEKVRIAGVKDSKKCSKDLMRKLIPQIVDAAAYIGVGFASVQKINEDGIASAWNDAALMALQRAPFFKNLVIDGVRTVRGYDGKQKAEPKADVVHWQVSAASILAKVIRDEEMKYLETHYPGYGWSSNAGYGTQQHLDALKEIGTTPFHRTKYTDKALSTSEQKSKDGPKRRKKRVSGPSRFEKRTKDTSLFERYPGVHAG